MQVSRIIDELTSDRVCDCVHLRGSTNQILETLSLFMIHLTNGVTVAWQPVLHWLFIITTTISIKNIPTQLSLVRYVNASLRLKPGFTGFGLRSVRNVRSSNGYHAEECGGMYDALDSTISLRLPLHSFVWLSIPSVSNHRRNFALFKLQTDIFAPSTRLRAIIAVQCFGINEHHSHLQIKYKTREDLNNALLKARIW